METSRERPSQRVATLAAVALSIAALTACSATEEPSSATPSVSAREDAVATAAPETPSPAPTDNPSANAGSERPSTVFQEVPDGYFVVDDGRAMGLIAIEGVGVV